MGPLQSVCVWQGGRGRLGWAPTEAGTASGELLHPLPHACARHWSARLHAMVSPQRANVRLTLALTYECVPHHLPPPAVFVVPAGKSYETTVLLEWTFNEEGKVVGFRHHCDTGAVLQAWTA